MVLQAMKINIAKKYKGVTVWFFARGFPLQGFDALLAQALGISDNQPLGIICLNKLIVG